MLDSMIDQTYRAISLTLLSSQVVLVHGMYLSWETGASRSCARRLLQLLMGRPSVPFFNACALLAFNAGLPAQAVCIAMLHSLSVLDLVLEFR